MSVETMIIGVVGGILSSLIGTLINRKLTSWLSTPQWLSVLNCKHAAYLVSSVMILLASYHQQSIGGQIISIETLFGLAAFALAEGVDANVDQTAQLPTEMIDVHARAEDDAAHPQEL